MIQELVSELISGCGQPDFSKLDALLMMAWKRNIVLPDLNEVMNKEDVLKSATQHPRDRV